MSIGLVLLEEVVVSAEGLQVNVPPVLTDNVQYFGPAGQVARGALTARRVTQSNNPIVWGVEAAALALNITGNLTASKLLRITAATTCLSAHCITPSPLLGMAGLAIANGLMEEESGA